MLHRAVTEGREQPVEAAPAVEEDPAEALSEAEETAIDSLDSGDAEEGEEEELSEEEKGRRIAAQWTHDPNAVGGEVRLPHDHVTIDHNTMPPASVGAQITKAQ